MAAAPTRTPDGDALFFDAILLGAAPGEASRIAGYAEADVQHWRKHDPAFADAWVAAIRTSLEWEADRRLRARYERPVVRREGGVATRNVCPDMLLFARYDALWREHCQRPTQPQPARTRNPGRRQSRPRPRGVARVIAWAHALFIRTPGAKAHGR
jgi:hypothetical protein